MEDTILIKNVDVNKIKYSEPKVLQTGARTVYINYNGKRPIFQLPWMSLPYGLNDSSEMAAKFKKEKKPEDEGKKSYDLTLSFKGSDQNIKIQQCLDKLKEIEQKIINDAFDNRIAWLREDYDGIKTVVAKLFHPIVKYDKDKDTGKVVGKYPPTIKIKVPYNDKNQEFTFDCEDKDGTEIKFKDIMDKLKGGKALVVIQLSGIWIAGGKFGCTWRLMRGRFQPSAMIRPAIIEDSDNDEENSRANTPVSDDDVVADALAASINTKMTIKTENTVASESEDDKENRNNGSDAGTEEEEDDDEVPPPPPPPTTKKGTKSRKA